MNDTQRNYETLLEAIKTNNIGAEELLNAFTNWHGLQLIDDDKGKQIRLGCCI